MDNVHFKITKGMYGLKQAAIHAYQQLQKNLESYRYLHIPNTVEMWKHIHKPVQSCLCADDFDVKYTNKEDAIHLLEALQEKYKMTVDWEGKTIADLLLIRITKIGT